MVNHPHRSKKPAQAATTEHTPTPWALEMEHLEITAEQGNRRIAAVCIPGPHGHSTAADIPAGDANGAFIVRAVNAFDANERKIDALVKALEKSNTALRDMRDWYDEHAGSVIEDDAKVASADEALTIGAAVLRLATL